MGIMRIPYIDPRDPTPKIRFISEPLKGREYLNSTRFTSYYGTVVCRMTLRNTTKMELLK